MSSGCSPSVSLSSTKDAQGSTKAKSRKRPSHHPAFSDAVSSASRRVRREVGRRPNQPVQAPGNASILPKGMMPTVLPPNMMPPMSLVHPTFGTGPTFYISPVALIHRPNDMLYLPLGQHILDYEPPHGFVIRAFSAFNGSTDPYNHMLHYNQVMTLNAGNNRLLCKVFLASLRGHVLAWFHKLPLNSINSFNELWAAFVLHYLCSVRHKRNISSLQTILK